MDPSPGFAIFGRGHLLHVAEPLEELQFSTENTKGLPQQVVTPVAEPATVW